MCSRKPQLHEQRKNTKKCRLNHFTKKCAETLLYIYGVRRQYSTV